MTEPKTAKDALEFAKEWAFKTLIDAHLSKTGDLPSLPSNVSPNEFRMACYDLAHELNRAQPEQAPSKIVIDGVNHAELNGTYVKTPASDIPGLRKANIEIIKFKAARQVAAGQDKK